MSVVLVIAAIVGCLGASFGFGKVAKMMSAEDLAAIDAYSVEERFDANWCAEAEAFARTVDAQRALDA